MISGGPSDADIFMSLADALADRFTVVTYDTRGNSRSSLEGPPQEDQSIELESEDAHSLLAAVSDERAFVFGSSGGAVVGLELVGRYPHLVRTLVAHEPPLTQLLPDAAQHRAHAADVHDTYLRDGVGAAMMKFLRAAGLEPPPSQPNAAPPSPEMQASMARMGRNAEHFVAHRFRAMASYVPDVAALRAAPTRIVVAGGAESHGETAYLCTVALAEQLGAPVVTFPGGHGGFSSHPVAFAETLDSVLMAAVT
jgi:pimeloyl-ACP methyl ester carboxylesterase